MAVSGQLGDSADVAGDEGVDRLVLLAAQGEQPVQALVDAAAGVDEVIVVPDRAREDLEHGHLADVGIGDGLEHVRQRLCVGIGGDLDGFVACRHGGGAVGGRRPDLDEEVGQPVDADLAGGRSADHGEDAGVLDALQQRALELLERGDLALQVLLQQSVVADDDALDQVVVHLVLLLLHLGGDLRRVGHTAVVEVGGVGEQIRDATKLGLRADRQLQRRDASAEPFTQLVESSFEAGSLPVELVDEDHPRHAEPGGQPPDRLGLHLHSIDRAHHEHGQVDDLQRRGDVAQEVGIPGGVDEVHLVAVPLEGHHRERQRLAPLLLLRIVVADRRAILHTTEALDGTRAVEQRFGEGGLSRTPVTDESDVADLLRRHVRQPGSPLLHRVRATVPKPPGPCCPRREVCSTAPVASGGRCRLPPSQLADGRLLAYDDVGDPVGLPVVYLHGTPDSRLARHPDDGVAAGLGVRLIAADRAGFGRSSRDPAGGLTHVSEDLGALADHLHLERFALLGWSAGGLAALAAAAGLGDRIRRVGLVGAVPPVEAYSDDTVVAALGPGRRAFAELAIEVPAAELAAELAPHLLPDPLTPAVAREHVLEAAGAVGERELAAVPGAAEQLATALVEATAAGRDGLVDDVARQLEPGLDLTRVAAPVTAWHGDHDALSPPAIGEWLAARLPRAEVVACPGAAHHLLFPRWSDLLMSLIDERGR